MSFSCKMKTIYQKYTRMADNWEYVNVWILKVTLLTAKFFKRTHNLAQVSTDRIYSTACTQCTYSLSSIMSKVININGYTNNLNENQKWNMLLIQIKIYFLKCSNSRYKCQRLINLSIWNIVFMSQLHDNWELFHRKL